MSTLARVAGGIQNLSTVPTTRTVVKFSRSDRTWDKSMVAIDDRGSANDNQECGCEVLAA